jgi:hypothetical protein
MSDRIGVVKMTYGFIEQAMHLPEGYRICGVRSADGFTDTIELAIEGPSMPERKAGEVPVCVRYLVTVKEDPNDLIPRKTFLGAFD